MNAEIALELNPALHLAAASLPPLRAVRVRAAGPREGLRLRVHAEPPVLAPHEEALPAFLDELHHPLLLAPDPALLRRPGEATLVVGLWEGEALLAEVRAPLRVYGPDFWPGEALPPPLLAAFVRPREAAMVGPEDPVAVPGPPGWSTLGQPLGSPTQLRARGQATPLELCALWAARAEGAGEAPLLLITRERPLMGLWLEPTEVPECVIDDPALLRTRVELGELRIVDPTGAPVDEAWGDPASFRYAVDLRAARAWGFWPPDEAPASAAAAPATAGSARLERYKRELLDLSLRNRLLNFREGRQSVPLLADDLDALAETLATGRSLAVRALDPRLRKPSEAQRVFLAETQHQGALASPLPESELNRRLLELFRRARASVVDSGVITLYLAFGMLRWVDKEPHQAPLLLWPVTLERGRGGFRLKREGEEPRVNVTLLAKLERVIDTSGLRDDEAGPSALFAAWKAVIPAAWELREELWLGPFAFTKAVMWEDLESRTDDILRNPIVRHLFESGGRVLPFVRPPVPPDAIDAARRPAEVLTVLDADPTQLAAIFAAEDGSSFVLQGPPGTGKSQTITNLIAALIAREKSVLFVSEKRAALEVVERRLRAVGLGPFLLELHAPDTSRKALMRQLAEAVQAAEDAPPSGWEAHAAGLEVAREELNSLAAALRRVGPYGQSVQAACAALAGLRDAPRVRVDWGEGPTSIAAQEAALRELYARLEETGPPANHPLRAVRLASWTPTEERESDRALEALAEAGRALHLAGPALAEALGLTRAPETDGEARDLERLMRLAEQDAPAASLREDPELLRARAKPWLALGARHREAREALAPRWEPVPALADLDTLQARFARWAGAFFAFLLLFFPRRRLRAFARGALPDDATIREDLGLAQTVRDTAAQLDVLRTEAEAAFGALWQGPDTEARAVELRVAWLGTARQAAEQAGRWAGPALRLVAEDRGLWQREAVAAWARALHALRAARERAFTRLRAEPAEIPDADRPLALSIWADRARISLPKLRAWTRLRAAVEAAAAAGPLVEAALGGGLGPDEALLALHRSIHEHFWEKAVEAEPRLADGVAHEDRIARWAALDRDALALARKEVRARVAARIPPLGSPGPEHQLLRHQLGLQQNHRPIRRLFREMPQLLRRLKPCALMSPLSVARTLDPALPGYDVVIFDEASQIPPWEAIGAIARGRQVIVVGDSKQLPPTAFFAHAGDEEAADELDLVELESILDEALVAGLPSLDLRWHYRSRHESLIAFSNRQFYDDRLFTFPAARRDRQTLGLRWVPVPTGVYDRGGSRTNRAEAEALVVELERVLDLPDRPSVGVVTFSMPQQRLIEDLVDALVARRPELEPRFDPAGTEPVFVKNLENVQGDEREVMLFSIGYAADARGVVAMNFGPLNRQGGERRLNVAITRARSSLVVFSTLTPEQIDLSRTTAAGPAQLRLFLDYAARGDAAGLLAATPAGTALEQAVADALRARGLTVHERVGQSGYRVALGVVDPAAPDRYLLGVETDGPPYAESACARERDRLRPEVLAALGWRLFRVWSADWWLEPDEVLRRLERAMRAASRPPPPPPPPPPAPDADALERLRERLSAPPEALRPPFATVWTPVALEPAEGDITEGDQRAALGRRLLQLVDAQGPIQLEAAARALMACWGRVQLNAGVLDAVGQALAGIPKAERPLLLDGYLWPAGVDPAAWRGLRLHEEHRREPHQIPPVEVANAAAWLLDLALTLDAAALSRELARLFGFGDGPKVRAAMDAGVARLIESGRALREGDAIRPR